MQIRNLIRTAIFCVGSLLVHGAAAAQPVGEGGPLYSELMALNFQLREETGQQRASTVVERYRSLVGNLDPCSHPVADAVRADDLFRATWLAQFYSLSAADTDALGCLYRQLARAGAATDFHTRSYAEALISMTRFAEANVLLEKVEDGDRPALPQITPDPAPAGNGQWRLLSLQSASQAVVSNWTPVPGRLQVIAVVHPSCHFSAAALAEITSSNNLAWLRERVLLLVPAGGHFPGTGMLDWNRSHPELPMQRMYSRDDWKPITSVDTPTFYLMKGAEVVQTFEGWPNVDGVERLRAALAR